MTKLGTEYFPGVTVSSSGGYLREKPYVVFVYVFQLAVSSMVEVCGEGPELDRDGDC